MAKMDFVFFYFTDFVLKSQRCLNMMIFHLRASMRGTKLCPEFYIGQNKGTVANTNFIYSITLLYPRLMSGPFG